jgi:predicted transcriptional regulator
VKVVTFNFSPETHKRLKILAAAEGKSMTDIVLEALGVYFDRQSKTTPGRTRKDSGASFPPMRPTQKK